MQYTGDPPKSCLGRCLGGPYDGMLLAHNYAVYPFLKPMFGFAITREELDHLTVEAVKTGEYRFSNGIWTWFGTSA